MHAAAWLPRSWMARAVLFASLVWAWSQWSSRSKNTLVMVEIAAYIAAGWLTIRVDRRLPLAEAAAAHDALASRATQGKLLLIP